MEDIKEHLIGSAVLSFSDNAEAKLAATQLLDEWTDPDDDGARDAIARWNAVDDKPGHSWWQIGSWVALVVASMTVLLCDYQEVGRYVAWREWIGGNMSAMPEPGSRFTRHLTHEQALLIGGGPKLPRAEALWRRHPDNPAYFAEYAIAHASEFQSLPPGFLETARRLDPENAWFTWFAASVEAKGALENKSVVHKESDGTERWTDTWKVLDQNRVDRASALIEEARSQPKFENFSNEMLLKRQALFPISNRIDLMDGIGQISTHSSAPDVHLMNAAFLQIGRSRLAAEAGDVAGFRDACQNGENFLRQLAGSEAGTLLAGVIEIGYVSSFSKAFAEGAEKLGLERESTRWKKLMEAATSRREASRANTFMVDGEIADPQLVGSTMFGNSLEVALSAIRTPPPLTDADLKPGRMLDHEILSRFCGYLSWVAMGFALLVVAGYRFRIGPLARRLAKRVEQLLDFQDWAWVVGTGIILPLVYVMAVNRLTPLGGHQFGMVGNAMLLPAGHFLGLIILWLVVPLQIARCRLAKRIPWLGFPKASWAGWLATGTALAFIPLVGWAGITRTFPPGWADWMRNLNVDLSFPSASDGPWRWGLAIGALALPVLWLIVCVCSALLSSRRRLFHHAITAGILVKTFPAAMILIALSTMAFKESERSWFKRDPMNCWDSAKPGWTAYEADIALQLKKEMRELLTPHSNSPLPRHAPD
jgi:hypothetical protein